MTVDQLVLGLAVTMLAVSFGIIGLTLAHGVVHDRRRLRRRERHEAAVMALGRVATGVADAGSAPAAVGRLSAAELVDVVQELVELIELDDDALLDSLASEFEIDALAQVLVRSRWWWRRLAGMRLVAMLRIREAAILERRADRSPAVRALLAEALSWQRDERAIGVVIELLDDADGLVRFAAANSVLRIGPAAAPALRKRLVERGSVSAEAIEVAGHLGDPSMTEAIEAHVSSEVTTHRVAAIEALGHLGAKAGTLAVMSALHDRDPRVRRAAVVALANARHRSAAGEIRERLADDDPQVVRAAAEALARLGPGGLLLLRREATAATAAGAACRHVLDRTNLADPVGSAR